MNDIILSQIPLSALLEHVKQAVREELAAAGHTSSYLSQGKEKPISTKELSKYLNVTECTIIRKRQSGEIPFIRIGSSVRFILSDVITALEKNK